MTPPPAPAPTPRSRTWMQDDDELDYFRVSGSASNPSLARIFSGSRYASVSATAPSHHPASTGLRSLTGEEGVEQENSIHQQTSPLLDTTRTDSHSCCGCCNKFHKQLKSAQRHRKCPHTLQICLVFFMFVLLGITERGSFVVLFQILGHHFSLDPGETVTLYFLIRFLIYVMYPVMGCLADTIFGHYKVIRTCLCVAWLGTAFMAISFASYESVTSNCKTTEDHCSLLPNWLFVGIGYAILGAGLTGIRVNLIPFGADQLPDASSGELSSYFYWHYFCITLGHFIAVIVLPLMFKFTYYSFVFLTITVTITVFLSTFILFPWKIVPKNGNPLKLVSGVVKTSFNSQRPIRRTAFDVGMPKPTRLDRAKIKYGGPYTLEEVEDVKTFFRILMIVMSCVGYYAVFSQFQSTTSIQIYKMSSLFMEEKCTSKELAHLNEYAKINFTCTAAQPIPASFFGASNLLPLLLAIILFDRLIYMCLNGWKWFSMLTRMAVGNFFIIASVVSAAAIEAVRMNQLAEVLGNKTVLINTISYYEDTSSYNVASPMSSAYIAIPYFFFVFAELLLNITAVEFIYAQSPGSMKGLLIGMLFASEGIAMGVSAIVTRIISLCAPAYSFFSFFTNTKEFYIVALDAMSKCSKGCHDGVLFVYILLIVVAVLSAIFFGVAAVRYKYRRRDQDPYMLLWLMPEDKASKMQHIIRKCCC